MDFDVNTLRSLATVTSFVTFIGIVWWAWSKRRASDFSEAANLPFIDDEMPESARHNTEKSNGVRS